MKTAPLAVWGVSELLIKYGPGYRLHLVQRGSLFIVLIAGDDKSSQDRDIRNAKALGIAQQT